METKVTRWATHNIEQMLRLFDRLSDPVRTVRYEEKQQPDLFLHQPYNDPHLTYLIPPLKSKVRKQKGQQTCLVRKINISRREAAQ